ncbi:hypothetical protein OHA72_17060 [Dactylosporangium sp. NBC_01737]|uniref:hypothetical protein n=1 Tax=Dactylosporangium sp. NBC_01737 TaxID=2975959 RepID=UPI002E12D2EA|nr:hypothetical protein OHA72_17060 [Dactylosporangium sp. NBC_01737]
MSTTAWRRALMPAVAVAVLLAGALLYTAVRSGPGDAGPTFYGDINFGGPAVSLGAGDYDLPQLQAAGKVNDNISSIRVPAGYTVTAFQHSGFIGTRWTFTADNPDMRDTGNNDAISSMRITRT